MARVFSGVIQAAGAIGALLLASALSLAAQQPDSVIPIDSLVIDVTRTAAPAARVPLSTSVLGKAQIQQGRPGIGLDESLVVVPGVFISNRHNFSVGSRISIRGFGARAAFGVRGVRILMDGIPLTLADGQSTLNNLDLGAAGRIEVIRGPASALYGNATGGVISVVTEDPPLAPFGADATVMLGTYGTGDWTNQQRAQLKAGGTFARGDWLVSLSRLEIDGYREHSATENVLINSRLRLQPGARTTLQFIVNGADVPRAESPGSLPADSARMRPRAAWPNNVRTQSGESARQLQAGVTLTHDGSAGRSEAMVYGVTRDIDNPLPFAYIAIDRRAWGARFAQHGSWMRGGIEAIWTLGADADAQRDARREFSNEGGRPGSEQSKDQVDDVRSIGPFAQVQWRLGPALDVLTGIRYDRVYFATDDHLMADGDDSGKRTLAAWSPMAGITFTRSPRLILFGNVSTAFQTPTTTELLNAPPAPGEPCCPAGFNPHLEPQHTQGFELGARGRRGAIDYEIALYRMNVRDELAAFQLEEAPGREFFRNLGRARHDGLELLIGWRASSSLTGTLSYTFNDFEVLEDAGGRGFTGTLIPGVPRHTGAAQIDFDLTPQVNVGADVRYQGEMFVDDANTTANDAAAVADLRLNIRPARLPRARLFVGGSNLFDARYNSSVAINAFGGRYFEPAPGRAWHVGVTWTIGGRM